MSTSSALVCLSALATSSLGLSSDRRHRSQQAWSGLLGLLKNLLNLLTSPGRRSGNAATGVSGPTTSSPAAKEREAKKPRSAEHDDDDVITFSANSFFF